MPSSPRGPAPSKKINMKSWAEINLIIKSKQHMNGNITSETLKDFLWLMYYPLFLCQEETQIKLLLRLTWVKSDKLS